MHLYREWKQWEVAWEEYRKVVWAARAQVRKAETLSEFHPAKGVKDSKKSYYWYAWNKRKTWESAGFPQKETGDHVT